jgi:hypothetical protein
MHLGSMNDYGKQCLPDKNSYTALYSGGGRRKFKVHTAHTSVIPATTPTTTRATVTSSSIPLF